MAEQWDQQSGGAGPSPQGEDYGEAPRKKAVWPWVLLGCGVAGFLGLVVGGILLGLMLPAVSRVRESARRATCKSNLRQIGLGGHMWADDNNEKFPPDFRSLMPNYIDNPKVFSCPSSPSSYQDFVAGTVTEASSSYAYLPGREAYLPGDFVLAYDKNVDNHGGAGFNVLFCDAHVEWRRATSLEEFNRLLDAQDAVVKAIKENPEDREEILQEYSRKSGGGYGGPIPATTPAPAPPSGGRY